MDLTTNNITHNFYKGKLMYAYNGEIYIYDYNTEKIVKWCCISKKQIEKDVVVI